MIAVGAGGVVVVADAVGNVCHSFAKFTCTSKHMSRKQEGK